VREGQETKGEVLGAEANQLGKVKLNWLLLVRKMRSKAIVSTGGVCLGERTESGVIIGDSENRNRETGPTKGKTPCQKRPNLNTYLEK